jgi:uncharacterized protein YodC (DUF2158 family)
VAFGRFRYEMPQAAMDDSFAAQCGVSCLASTARPTHRKQEAWRLFRLGNLVRHRSGGPIMVVDREVPHSSIEPRVGCVWIEAGERRHASFKEGELHAVHGDGRPRTHHAEE